MVPYEYRGLSREEIGIKFFNRYQALQAKAYTAIKAGAYVDCGITLALGHMREYKNSYGVYGTNVNPCHLLREISEHEEELRKEASKNQEEVSSGYW